MKIKQTLNNKRNLLFLIAGAIVLFAIFGFLTGGVFFRESNILSLIRQPVYVTFMAWGVFLIFSSGIMDMSVAANMMLSANVGVAFALNFHMGYLGLILGAVLSATVFTTISMSVCVFLKIPSWISSLGMAMIYEVFLNILGDLHGGTLPSFTTKYRGLGQIPACIIIWLIGAIVVYFIYNRTSIGLSIRALGSNIAVAENMGLKRNRVLIFSAIVGGIFLGISSAVNISFSGTIRAVSGLSSISQLFKPIAAWMLAKAFERDINLPIGILIFSFFITAFFNFLTFMGAPTGTIQDMVLGAMVIIFAAIAAKGSREVVK